MKIEEVLSITTPPHMHMCVRVCIHHLLSSLRYKLMMTTIVKHIHLKSRAGLIRDVFKWPFT